MSPELFHELEERLTPYMQKQSTKYFSIVLLAVVDADYKFRYIDVGGRGGSSDSGIFLTTTLRDMAVNEELNFPQSSPIVPGGRDIPYFFLGDDAFALKRWLLKPYSARNLTHDQRIYNYRISRARRVVENAFGILAARFRILLTTIPMEPWSNSSRWESVTRLLSAIFQFTKWPCRMARRNAIKTLFLRACSIRYLDLLQEI